MNSYPDPRLLRIADFTYDLPDARIARYPLAQRDASKLLVYKDGQIESNIFSSLADHLPEDALLVVNNARVVKARMLFKKPSGGSIEIFCLEPHPQYADITNAMTQTGSVLWQCLVGGAAKWKANILLTLTTDAINLTAALVSRNESDFTIRFSWTPATSSFAEVLTTVGQIPLPPYLGRAADTVDETRYQTMFAVNEGSVAAPTASLHFTEELLASLETAGISTVHLTLHVGAGTFMPVKSEMAGGHSMHYEWVEVSRDAIESIRHSGDSPVVAGGTTALRTLESLYWMGCKVIATPSLQPQEFIVGQWEPYSGSREISKAESLDALSGWMDRHTLKRIVGRTGILIAPGYSFKIVDALITNFHQPQSTLLLLVAAFIGDDWKKVYEFAMRHDFRFLSYGDGSLLWRKDFTFSST